MFTTRPCISTASLLEDVVRFLAEFPREFIILDFHNFQMGMTNRESYRDLLALIDVSLLLSFYWLFYVVVVIKIGFSKEIEVSFHHMK